MKYYLTLFLLLASLSFTAQTLKERTVSIDPFLAFQNYEHFKRLTLSSPDSPIEFLENFNFEWGYIYQITVIEIKLEETLSDGTEYEFAFQDIISKTKVEESTTFSLFIDPLLYYKEAENNKETLKQINDSTYVYFDQVELIIPKNLLSQMDQLVASKQGKRGTFQFVDTKRIRLVSFK